ncbi:MAG TPA: uracil-DNA glycosylase family protein [Patescibacteria group bacterium]
MKNVESKDCSKCPVGADNPNWGIEGEKDIRFVAVLESSDWRALRTDYMHELFLSRSGRAIKEVLGENLEYTLITNSAKCLYQGGFKKPTREMYERCAENVRAQINEVEPELIICFGEKAAEAVTGQKFSEVVGKIIGNVVVVHHPRVMTIVEKQLIKEILGVNSLQTS